jgi:hypothetical protein
MTDPEQQPNPDLIRNIDGVSNDPRYQNRAINLSITNAKGEFESPEETTSRLKRADASHALEIKLKFVISLAAIALIAGICVVCIYIKLTASQEDKWAETTLTAIIGGVIGYLSAKSKSSS